MALLAVCSQLSLVDVGVAILAVLSDIGEHWPDVTFGARNRCVHVPKRVLRLIMIEFRNSANRLPGFRCVAILAGDLQISVGTVRASRDLCQSDAGCSGKHQ